MAKTKLVFSDLLPGETPIEDTSGLRIKGISTRRELSQAEAENIRHVLVKYFADPLTPEVAPFHIQWARDLHREMYGDVWIWAGEFRLVDLNLGCHFTLILENLHNLLEDLAFWHAEAVNLLEQATRLHHRAVSIHPFLNGNGRWGRMLTNIWLVRHGSPYVAWPEGTIGSASAIRDAYVKALRAADEGDLKPLLKLHQHHLARQ